jgi:hypothetical protein
MVIFFESKSAGNCSRSHAGYVVAWTLRYIPSGVSCVINFAHFVLICAYLLLTLVLGQTHKHAIVNAIWLPSEYDDSIACVCSDVTLSLWEEVAASQLTFISFRFYFFLLLSLVFGTLRYYLVLGALIQVELETS